MAKSLNDLKREYYLAQAPGALVTDSLADLEYKFFSAASASLGSFDYNKTSNILNIPDTFTEINRLNINRPAGVYLFGVSFTWIFSVDNRSAFFRFSTDGGQNWGNEYNIQPSDGTDRHPFMYSFPIVHSGGTRSVIIQARKESINGTLDVSYCDLWYEKTAG